MSRMTWKRFLWLVELFCPFLRSVPPALHVWSHETVHQASYSSIIGGKFSFSNHKVCKLIWGVQKIMAQTWEACGGYWELSLESEECIKWVQLCPPSETHFSKISWNWMNIKCRLLRKRNASYLNIQNGKKKKTSELQQPCDANSQY